MSYENDHGLLIDPDTNTACGYIFNFEGHGAYAPSGRVPGISQEDIDRHNALLAGAEWDAMLKRGRGVLYWSKGDDGRYRVGDWPGGHRVSPSHHRTSFHNFAGQNGRTDVWFALDDSVWHGVNIGDNQILRVRRTKERA